MNYYEHHLGDYLRETAHLSMLEDGAYRRLLDIYYIKEQPLPSEPQDVYRLVRAVTKQDKEAVMTVLREFFEHTEKGWTHRRCEKEIARFLDKQQKAKSSAEARWAAQRAHNERNANAMRTHSGGNAPNHQTPVSTSLRSVDRARGTRLPGGWVPDDWANVGGTSLAAELPKFRDYWMAQPGQKGVKADWNATWRNWLRKAAEYETDRRRQSTAKLSAVERVRQACNLGADGFPMGPDDGDLRPQVGEQLWPEADGSLVEGDFRTVEGAN